MRVFGNFDIEVFSTISWSKLRYRYTISTFNIGIYRCRRQISSMSYTTSNTTSGYTDVEACPFRCRTRYCIAAFPPPAAGRTGHVPAGNLNMTRNLKFSSCPGSHHPLLLFGLYNISQVFSQLAKSNLLVMQVWWLGLSSRVAGLRLTVSGPCGHRMAELEI